MNRILAEYAKQQEKISSEKLRLDTTVYETNIHYPTDSSLLWDSFRTLARLLQQIQQELPQLPMKHRFHINKVKKLAYFITRNGGSNGASHAVHNKSKRRKVKSTYRKLIERVNGLAILTTGLQRLLVKPWLYCIGPAMKQSYWLITFR